MKNTRLALVLAITSLAATPVIAASLTMLQFGSFETRAEAEQRLADVKSKHAAEIGAFSAGIREVKLPPDNLTVYRTQAGPVASRSAAQSICAKLASVGDECYIVQTAMVETSAASTMTAEAVAPAAPLLATPMADATKTPAAAPDLTSRLNSLKDVPARDASSRAALSSVSSSLIVTDETPAAPVASGLMSQPSTSMQSALDKAVSDQPKVEADVARATASGTAAPSSRSFWSRLNPFSDSAEPASQPKPEAALADPKAAPVETVTTAAIESPVKAEPPKLEPVVAEPAKLAPMTAEQAKLEVPPVVQPVAVPVVGIPATPVAVAAPMVSAPVIMQAEPMHLPPPPAPLKAQDRAMLAQMKEAQPLPPASTGTITVAPLAPAPGIVNVEEAKRVPVTQSAMPPAITSPVIALPAMVPVVPPQAPISLSPSATDGQKTIWAQIGPFADDATALLYWSNYRQSHPDFPVVRVRVTTPYQIQVRNTSGNSWLRVGPVTREGFIRSLCGSVPKESGLRCGTVTDLGIGSSPQGKVGLLSGSRYQR